MAVGPTMRRIFRLVYDSTAKALKSHLVDSAGTEVIGVVTASPASNTLLDRLKTIATNIASIATTIVLAAGTAVIGKVRLVTATGDEVTEDTGNSVQVKSIANSGVDIGDVDVLSIAAGSNIIGKVGIDQTIPGTTNNVAVTGMGEIQDSPTTYTLLDRLKTVATGLTSLLTGIVLATGTNIVGWFKIKRVPVITSTTGDATAVATLAPAAAFQLLEVRFHLASALAAAETLTITLDANDGSGYDTVLLSLVLGTTILNVVVEFGGDSYFFESGDQIVIALSANTGSDVWGCQTVHELV